MRFLAALGMTVLLLSAPAFAEEVKEEAKTEEVKPAVKPPGVYSPDDCEFTITFPETPYESQRCEADGAKRCYKQVSYTKVFDMESTVNFRVTCNPADEGMYEQYNGPVMEAALKAMTDRSTVETFDTSFREDTNYKQAGLVGEGQVGVNPTLYIAQLWIGHKSVLSVEAEMIGAAHDKADALFGEVLKSVQFVEK